MDLPVFISRTPKTWWRHFWTSLLTQQIIGMGELPCQSNLQVRISRDKNHLLLWETIKADQEPQLEWEAVRFFAGLVGQLRKLHPTKSHKFNRLICRQRQTSRASIPQTTMTKTRVLEASSDEATTQTREETCPILMVFSLRKWTPHNSWTNCQTDPIRLVKWWTIKLQDSSSSSSQFLIMKNKRAIGRETSPRL